MIVKDKLYALDFLPILSTDEAVNMIATLTNYADVLDVFLMQLYANRKRGICEARPRSEGPGTALLVFRSRGLPRVSMSQLKGVTGTYQFDTVQ